MKKEPKVSYADRTYNRFKPSLYVSKTKRHYWWAIITTIPLIILLLIFVLLLITRP